MRARLWYNPHVRLKSITLQGFKSFAARQTLEFPAPITAIVGPNGSGKSNIADAIRWVLGEQSLRSLRGGALEDVIFAGTDRRRPVGMAEVTIALEGGGARLGLPFDEVSITRRTFRSGESEFFINRAPCRLKDIQEAFLDTGLGRNAWALVGQGEVDAALNARPQERRLLFEEAAGVMRYRTQREEALRRLTEAEADAVRL
ncbi:MAG TPA: AAA family ATPase, partial [Limnochordia bacterium]